MPEWLGIALAVAGALGLRELIGKFIDRKATAISSEKVRMETKATEVEILRGVLEEVKQDSTEKSTRLTALEQSRDELVVRMSQLEERERHNLTRAAVHEAWDQLAFQFILAHDPKFTPPPPIMLGPAHPPEEPT